MERVDISKRGNCDFISMLPDPILHHIMGMLKLKKAVQTCALSKRWEHLWTSLPLLCFDYKEDLDDSLQTHTESENDESTIDESISASGRFVKFVDTLLLRRKPFNLVRFCLNSYELSSYYARHQRDWVRYAVNHNARVLHLSLYGDVPFCIYTCTSLEELYLDDDYTNLSVKTVNLPKLTDLNIWHADLNSNYVKTLLSGCPILEFIRLKNCTLFDCAIAHESLKVLSIVNCQTDETKLLISTPNMISFFYEGELSLLSKTTLNMPSLSCACLVSCDSLTNTSIEGIATCLRFFTNVDHLELHFKCGLQKELPVAVLPLELPIFEKLENVIVSFCTFSCFQVVTWILKSAPNLKKLKILQGDGCIFYIKRKEASSAIAVFSSKKLEMVEIKYWIYDQMVQRLIDTLMDGAKELENLEIRLSKYKNSKQYMR